MTSVLSTLRDSFSPLRFPNFRLYLGGQAISLIGTWLQGTAQNWLVWELTKSEAASSIVPMLNALPILFLGPWAGAIADRVDRRKLLIVSQVGAMLLAFALAVLVTTKTAEVWHVYVLSLLLGVVAAFDLPAQQAFLGDLSSTSEVRKAVNLNAMILQISRMIGPAIAGLVVARIGMAEAFWLNGISFLAVIASLIAVRSNQVRSTKSGPITPLRDVNEALRFIRTQPRMIDLFIFATLVVFLVLSIIMSQLPAVADKLLNGDAQTYSVLQSASGAGALIAVVLIMPLAQSYKRSGLMIAGATIWISLWLVVFALSRSLPLSALALLMGSMGAPTVIATSLGLVQFMSPPGLRARVLSLFTMITFGLQTVAVLLVGLAAEYLGVSTAIEINAILLFSGAVLMLILRGDLRRWEINRAEAPPIPATEPAIGD